MGKIQVTIYISAELAEDIEKHKSRSDLTRNQIINRILRRYYLTRKKEKELRIT